MKRAVLIGLIAVLVAAGIYCGYRYYKEAYLPRKQVADADAAQRELFGDIRPDIEAPDNKDGSSGTDAPDPLAELKAVNADAVGWITIDGTSIDFPVVQTTDNSFYLDKGFDKKYNYGLGCPFLDRRCKSDFRGFCSIVYAHHIQNSEAMFADIAEYKDSAFMKAHPEGLLLTSDGVHRVRFFAYLTIPSTSFAYNTDITDSDGKKDYIGRLFDEAKYTSGLTASELEKNDEPHLLLLSTCTYEYWEARGVLVGIIE
ncbi:sortase B [Ruminococcaceae bacterium FB2012]|nr:sortase B [Ruminococcaceae bacterium FB2012]